MITKRTLLCALACATVFLTAADARAQSYPTKPIRMIVPFPPGGPIDVMGRLIGDRLRRAGPDRGDREPPRRRRRDRQQGRRQARARRLYAAVWLVRLARGHARALQERRLRSGEELCAGRRRGGGPLVLAVHPAVPAKTVAELVAHAKANPGKLNYGSGLGTPPHIA